MATVIKGVVSSVPSRYTSRIRVADRRTYTETLLGNAVSRGDVSSGNSSPHVV